VFFNLIHSNKKGKMMMTKKRKIKSTLSGEPKPQFVRAVLAAGLGVLIAIGLGGAEAQGVEVYPTGDPWTDVPAVQNAVNAGGTVILKTGVFDFGTNGYVDINNEVTIQGEPGTVIKNGGQADPAKGVFNSVAPVHLEVRNIRFEEPMFCAVFIKYCDGAVIRNNVMWHPEARLGRQAKGIAINDFNRFTGQVTGDIIIEDNEITINPNVGMYPEGITVFWPGGAGANYNIRDNIINAKDGIKIFDPDAASCLVEDNIIDATGTGIVVRRAPDCDVRNNLVDADWRGIWLRNTDGAEANNNTVTGKPWRGITASNSTGTLIRNNTVSITSTNGLAVEAWNADGTEITSNNIEIQNPTSWGAATRLGGSDGCTVTDNTITGEAPFAILLDRYSSNNQILRNDLRGFSVGSFVNPAYDSACDISGTNFSDPLMTAETGKYGNALSFDSWDKDRVIDPDGANYINGLSAFTVAIWIKSDQTNTDKGFLNGEDPDGGDNVFTMRYDRAGGRGGGTNAIKAGITVKDPITGLPVIVFGGASQQIESSEYVQTTAWQHVALVWSSGQPLKLYINGVLDMPTVNDPGVVGTTTGAIKFLLGAGAKDAAGGWDGLIDEVHLIASALNEAEIHTLMNNPGALGGELVYYNFDSFGTLGDFQIVPDGSGNGHDGYVNPHFCDPSSPLHQPKYLPGAFAYLDEGTSGNVLFEAGMFPPGEGGAHHSVIDLGTNNRVVGLPAKGIDDPGIGALVRWMQAAAAKEAAALAAEE
jgi:parallel beta-helix repeat protein